MSRQVIRAVFIVLLSALFVAACASGSSIVVGEVREPITPDQVRLYLEAPSNYEVIGIVDASSDAGWTEQGSVDYAVEELKNRAAKICANGVLLGSTGEQTSSVIGGYGTGFLYAVPVTAKTASGRAIFVYE